MALEETVPQTQCPSCGDWLDDLDGWGVLAHEACGYCDHPSLDGDGAGRMICGICGAADPEGHEWGVGSVEVGGD